MEARPGEDCGRVKPELTAENAEVAEKGRRGRTRGKRIIAVRNIPVARSILDRWRRQMVEKSELQKRENQISGIILDAAIAIHSALGPGLLESAYEACLCYELNSRGLKFQTQVALPIKYGNVTLSTAYRMDFLVEDLVIVELKAID